MTQNPEDKEIERLRGVLRECLKRVPAHINSASVQTVRDYKTAYVKAAKAVDKKVVKLAELQTLIHLVS